MNATATYDWVDGTLKTTQSGRLVIQITADTIAEAGEILRLNEHDPRLFLIEGRGQSFGGISYRGSRKWKSTASVYLYVAEVSPAPVVTAEAPEASETCVACGSLASSFCPMSEDGEGPHQIVAREAITPDDVDFLRRVAIHDAQGAAER